MCKEAGLKGLAELVDLTGVGDTTLIGWYKRKPQLFRIVILGAVKLKEEALPATVVETEAGS
jgi:hypothetical protein